MAPLGQASIDYRYVNDSAGTAEVSLSNYNILLDGTHLNDGALPERIELFDLQWSGEVDQQAEAQVLNLAFAENNQWRDYVFSVGNEPLPDLSNPETAQSVLANATFSVPDGAQLNNAYTLQLEDIPGVEVAGVIQQMFEAEQAEIEANDRFDFIFNSDREASDTTEFDIAARAQDDDHLAPADHSQQNSGSLPADIDPYDPGVDMPSFDDLAG